MLDTNTCIRLINKSSEMVLKRLLLCKPGEVGISAITHAELFYGAEKSARREQNIEALSLFTAPLEIAEFELQAATTYGALRATIERKGTPIGPLDTLIAAQALTLEVTLVTNNVREFRRVTNLKLEDWTA